MGLILDENLPLGIRDEIKDIQGVYNILDVDESHKGMLDFELADLMEEEDIMFTGDLELHRNLIKTGKRSVYYDIQRDNILEVQVKLAYYLRGYDNRVSILESRGDMPVNANTQLRRRFDELKKENAALKVRVNVLEGKLQSILNTARTGLEE